MKFYRFVQSIVLKSSLILTALFTLYIAVIRAQPYDDRELRSFLIPTSDCIAPCWQGIRPGETNVFGVLEKLKANEWVSTVHYENYSTFSNGYIRWGWSGQRPSMIASTGSTNLWFDENIAQNFYIETQVHFGDVWLLLGQPDWYNIYRMYNRIRIDSVYKDQVMMVTFEIPCSAGGSQVWLAETDIVWIKTLPEEGRHSGNLSAPCQR